MDAPEEGEEMAELKQKVLDFGSISSTLTGTNTYSAILKNLMSQTNASSFKASSYIAIENAIYRFCYRTSSENKCYFSFSTVYEGALTVQTIELNFSNDTAKYSVYSNGTVTDYSNSYAGSDLIKLYY